MRDILINLTLGRSWAVCIIHKAQARAYICDAAHATRLFFCFELHKLALTHVLGVSDIEHFVTFMCGGKLDSPET